jgi:hypothetical protein
MRLEEVKKHYKTWTNLAHDLRQGMNTHQYWRRIGYIPFTSQLLIQHKSNGLLEAREEDAKPREE